MWCSQLFTLVNTLLSNNRTTAEHDLSIGRYAVVPLSPNSGLIGWVPNCDTLHALIREHREARKVPLNVEHRLMLTFAPDYDHLQLIGKVSDSPSPNVLTTLGVTPRLPHLHSVVDQPTRCGTAITDDCALSPLCRPRWCNAPQESCFASSHETAACRQLHMFLWRLTGAVGSGGR
jgi:hypothetical protein